MIRLKYIVSYGTSIDLTCMLTLSQHSPPPGVALVRVANSRTDANVDAVIWSVLESFTAIICASLICLRPLIVKLLPASFPTTETSGTTRTPTPGWAKPINLKLASKLRNSGNRLELHSRDNLADGGSDNIIRVQKSWVTETSPGATESLEMQARSSFGAVPRGKDSWDRGG